MNKSWPVFCVCGFLLAAGAGPALAQPAPQAAFSFHGAEVPVPDFSAIPLSFIPNGGQAAPEALFYARASQYTLWITRAGLVFDSYQDGVRPGERGGKPWSGAPGAGSRSVSELVFPGADPRVRIEALGGDGHRVRFVLGSDPSRWISGLEASKGVLYRGLFRGVDLKVYGVEKEIEYDWIVNPGGRVRDIRFEYRGARATRLETDGSLVVRTAHGDLVHRRPVAYQEIAGRRVGVEARFLPLGGNRYGFRTGAYDLRRPLVIDPVVLVSASYLGGRGYDSLSGLALDRLGNIYITGDTKSANFPVKNPVDGTLSGSGYDMIIVKMDPTAKRLVYSTYLGGSDWDSGSAITVDATGAAYVGGWTKSRDFPVKNAFDPTFNGNYDGVFLKLSPAGDALVFSSYFGSRVPAADDGIGEISVDGKGYIYLAGSTDKTNLPVRAGFDMTHNGGIDGFIAKLSPSGRSLVYSTYYGGSGDDYPFWMSVDASGAVYTTGWTRSGNFPKKNAFQKALKGGEDAFVLKLNPSGTSLGFSTLLGGSKGDTGFVVRTDAAGNVYVGGRTESPDFPVLKAFDATWNGGDYDGFLAKLAPTGKSLVFSTFLGGRGDDEIGDVILDGKGYIYLTCETDSRNIPVKNAYSSVMKGGSDGYLAKLSPNGRSLVFGTFIGGSDYDSLDEIAQDAAGTIVALGYTRSVNFPVKNAFDKTYAAEGDGVVVRLSYSAGAGSRTGPGAKR